MKKSLILVFLLVFAVLSGCPVVRPTAQTLASTMNDITNGVNWGDGNYRVQHTGVIFNRISVPNYDTGTILGARLMQLDGFGLPDVSSVLRDYPQSGVFPSTYGGWRVYDRYAYHLYDWAAGTTYASKWDKTAALAALHSLVTSLDNLSLTYVSQSLGQSLHRYYDEHAEGWDLFLGLGDVSFAETIWNWAYADHWNGQYWGYDGTSGVECEAGSHAILAAKLYAVSGHSLPNFDAITKDLTYKFLRDSWGSPLWGSQGVVVHLAYRGDQERLENTEDAWAALQMYAKHLDSTSRQNMVNMLAGSADGHAAWEHLMQSGLNAGGNKFYMAPEDNPGQAPSDEASCVALKTLFLTGIVPDGGSLAIPALDEMYQDTEMIMPATHFRFNYATRTITIPVNSGNLRFIFGTAQTGSVNFPSAGIYNVQFSNDWNSVTSVVRVSGLYANLPYLEVSSATPTPCDLNNDGKVGLQDLVILAEAFGSKPGDSNWNPNADIDSNGLVGLSDLVILAQNYGKTA